MSIHERVLDAALGICRERGGWTFRPREIVAALPDLNRGSVRTHVMSRLCINAPPHHPHRWPYFRRIRRSLYEIAPAWRRRSVAPNAAGRRAKNSTASADVMLEVRESDPVYLEPERPDPVIAAYEKDVDRTLIRRRLRLGFQERLLALESWMRDIEELRVGVRRSRRKTAK